MIAIEALPVGAADVFVESGTYTWGDAGDIGFRLNIIGEGIGNTIVQHSGSNLYAAQIRSRDTYIEGISFVGGETVFDVRNAPKLTIVDSEFTGSTLGDGTNIVNSDSVVVYGSIAHHNQSDGFSYTNPNGAPMEVFEAYAVGSDNGLDTAWNSQRFHNSQDGRHCSSGRNI